MAVWVCLLRAVNLGARNKVSMAVLRDVLEQGGFDEVRTYVQSGNVVARSSHRSRERVAALVRMTVAEHFGVDTPVVVRTPPELREVLAWNPFPDAAAQRPQLVQVCHLLATPEPAAVEAVCAADVPEQIAVRGEEVVVDYGQGIQGSKVSPAWLARRLGVEGTARNWRTLTALVEMTRD
ncbi:MAG: hypothetical protein K0Q93_2112 [Nocardioidaceae bacterium]|jgi:uncharacterized protein (DUF1697 family)|nr:hypothetical protein [Nocardioidaceae bacterium]